MKIYAKQVPPEYQESPLFQFDWPENVHVYGNRYYNEHGKYSELCKEIEYMSEWLQDARDGCAYASNHSFKWALYWHVQPDAKREYNRAERLRWLDIIERYEMGSDFSDYETRAVCDALELVTGIKYEADTISGCCQGDWQEIIYPAEYGRDWLKYFEAEYFNTGSEWIVHDENTDPTGPEDINGFSVYCHGWKTEDIKLEIAEAYGAPDAEVILYQHTGYTKTSNWEAV